MFVLCSAGASGVTKNFELRNGQNCSEVSGTAYAKRAVRIVHHLNWCMYSQEFQAGWCMLWKMSINKSFGYWIQRTLPSDWKRGCKAAPCSLWTGQTSNWDYGGMKLKRCVFQDSTLKDGMIWLIIIIEHSVWYCMYLSLCSNVEDKWWMIKLKTDD